MVCHSFLLASRQRASRSIQAERRAASDGFESHRTCVRRAVSQPMLQDGSLGRNLVERTAISACFRATPTRLVRQSTEVRIHSPDESIGPYDREYAAQSADHA